MSTAAETDDFLEGQISVDLVRVLKVGGGGFGAVSGTVTVLRTVNYYLGFTRMSKR